MIKPATSEAATDNLHLVGRAERHRVKCSRSVNAEQKMEVQSRGERTIPYRPQL